MLIPTLMTTGTHAGGFSGRPRRMASVSRNTALHAGHRHAPERRPTGAISVPSLGQAQAFSATSVMFATSGTLRSLTTVIVTPGSHHLPGPHHPTHIGGNS